MHDVRSRLKAASRMVEAPVGGWDRLVERRVRSRRRQRVAALAVALVVAAGSIAVVGALLSPRSDDIEPPAEIAGATIQPIPALWPEHDAGQLQATQAAVDAGDVSVGWRLDAEETAVRFVRSVLGWKNPDERLVHTAVEAPNGLVTVDVFTVPASCHEESCDVVHGVIVQLLRLGEADGIWSVISAENPSFNMQFRIGQSVRIGDELEVISGHPSGSEIAIGVKVFEPCSGFRGGTAVVQDNRVRVAVRGVDEGCLAYVYAMTPAASAGVGRTLFDDASGSGAAIDDIAVAPVFIVAPDGSGSVSEVPQPEEA